MKLLGVGGMGEVWRAADVVLGNFVALKTLRAETFHRGTLAERFRREARIAARVQHPGTVPVHDLGDLPDGRPFYTMAEISGMNFGMAIEDAWTAPTPDLRPLLEVFRAVCRTLAYVHSRGVVHLDVKPGNIMLGPWGEVLVVDWGLAWSRDEPGGWVPGAGTRGYAPPEQERGLSSTLAPAADIHALGATLAAVLTGQAPRLPVRTGPEELVALAHACLDPDPGRRPQDASVLVATLDAWLAGAQRRARALDRLARAADQEEGFAAARTALARARREAARRESANLPWSSLDVKRAAWDAAERVIDATRSFEAAAERLEAAYGAALVEDPACAEVQDALADYFQRRHAEAERAGDVGAEASFFARLLRHDRGRFQAYREGLGHLRLETEPPGASAVLHPLVVEDQRLVPGPGSPVERLAHGVDLPMGRYLLRLTHPGCAPVTLPLRIERLGAWDNVPPDADGPAPVLLPPAAALGPEDCYVPAGWFAAGGDDGAAHPWPAERRWVGGFVMRRFPVRVREYLAWLRALHEASPLEAGDPRFPRYRSGAGGLLGVSLVRPGPDGLVLVPDADGDLWDPEHPIGLVHLDAARAYARGEAERTGLPWRLPTEEEWEKAARGVDGRIYPWGDHFDASFARVRDTLRDRQRPALVEEHPADTSPYGIRGLGGNVRCWCLPAEGADAQGTPVRGGAWTAYARGVRSARRMLVNAGVRVIDCGIRLVRPYP